MEEKNTQLVLVAHTMDLDDNVGNITIQYKLKCTFLDGTIERPLIEEIDLAQYKINKSGSIDNRNSFIFKDKKYFISDIQPNFKKVFRMNVEFIRTAPTTSKGNETLLQVEIRHLEKMKPVNDAMLKTL